MNTFLAVASATPVSTLLLALIVITSAVGLWRAPWLVERSLFRPYWLVRRREYATLVTSGFVHADLGHLFFNAFTFWAFAFALEHRIGSAAFAALYAFGLLVSDAGTYVKHRRNPNYQTLGASGAILAVLFASIVYFPTGSIFILPIPVPIPAPLFALGYLAFTFYSARHPHGRINHDAHLGGAIAGVVFVVLTDAPAVASAMRAVFG